MRDGDELAQPGRLSEREEADDFSIGVSALDGSANPPHRLPLALRSRGGRAATLAATTLLVAVVVAGLFIHATSDPGEALDTLLGRPTATPSATLVPGANTIYFSNGVPWGALTIDGKRMPSADLTGDGVTVPQGIHHLVYQARYFPTLRCVFSAPPALSDTCPLDTSDSTSQFMLTQGVARVLDLGSTGASLQADQRDALIQLADNILSAQTLTATIAPGERYLDDQGDLVTATEPLHFTLTVALGGAEPQNADDTSCTQFCPDPALSAGGQPAGAGWSTRLTVSAYWAITDASGRRLTGVNYEAGLSYPESAPVIVNVQLTAGGWQIDGLEGSSADAVANAVGQAATNVVSGEDGDGFGTSTLAGRDPLDGCVIDVGYSGYTSRLFWRFGALLTVDASAQRIFPLLPVATAAEQAAVTRILAQSSPGQ